MPHFAALHDHAHFLYSFNSDITYMKLCIRSSYLSDSGISAGSTLCPDQVYQCGQVFPSNKIEQTHTLDEILNIRQLINTVEFLSIYSKD